MKNSKKRGNKMTIFLCILAVLAIIITVFLLYYNKAFPEALAITETMEKIGNDYYFKGDSKLGFIIFSGAKADEKAYAYMAKLLHDEGHSVVLPKVPFHMSAFGINHGVSIIESNPEIEKWILIGHSLGGLPTGRIAVKVPDKLIGVAFLASYMGTDLSELDISAIRIKASNDKIMSESMLERNLNYLPENSISITIDGANHKGFGAYGSLSRDGEATMSWKEQQEQTVELILNFFTKQIEEM